MRWVFASKDTSQNRSFQLKRVKFHVLAPAFPIFVLAGSSIPAVRQIEWPMKLEKKIGEKKGKLEEGKILNNWCGGLLWVDWLELRQLRKYFFLSFICPKNGATFQCIVVIFPSQCWFPSTKKKRTPVTKNVTYREKKTLVLMNKLAFFNDQPHHTFISSWKCKVNLQTAKFNGSIHQKAKKTWAGTIGWYGKNQIGGGK